MLKKNNNFTYRKKVNVIAVILAICFTVNNVYALPVNVENSAGIITCYFDNVKLKSLEQQNGEAAEHVAPVVPKYTNGFLVHRGDKIYFLTVLHVSKIFNNEEINNNKAIGNYPLPNKAEIKIPKINITILIESPKDSFFDGDNIKDKEYSESVDILCIDVTSQVNQIDKTISDKFMSYDSLSSRYDEYNKSNKFLCGYAQSKAKNGYAEPHINNLFFPKDGFGGLFYVGKQKIRGFTFDLKTEKGDCGRPIIVEKKQGYFIIGLVRIYLPEEQKTLTNDSITILKVINAKENRK